MSEPIDLNLTQLRDAIAAKKCSAADAVGASIKRIEQQDGDLHAFEETLAEEAVARAAKVDAGELTGPLAGVPIALKNNLCTTVGRTTCSSRMLEHYRSPFNATAVEKLEAAGAIIIGKTVLDEFAMGSSTENAAFGGAKNPWDASRVPGGSSGGSAVAVAANMVPGALGSDTGGSIRQPAAFCGVVGLKPTYSRVSRYGLVAYGSSLDQIGPITRSVEDAALLLQVISGGDANDSTCSDVDVSDYTASVNTPIEGARIGIARQYMSDANDPAINAAIDNAVKVFEQQGATVVEVDLPHTEYGVPTYYIVATAEASSNLARYDGVHYGHRTEQSGDLYDLYARSRSEGFGDEVKRRIMLGTHVLSSGYYDAYYNRALKVRRLIKNDFDAAFKQCDVILCPPTPAPAFRIGENTDDPLQMYLGDIYTVTANLAGIPGIMLPGGFTETDGKTLPIGVQLLGAHFEEEKLLRLARMFEQATEFHQRRPSL